MARIAITGAGSRGTALARPLAGAGHEARFWANCDAESLKIVECFIEKWSVWADFRRNGRIEGSRISGHGTVHRCSYRINGVTVLSISPTFILSIVPSFKKLPIFHLVF